MYQNEIRKTHVINAIDERVIAAVRHGKPITTQPNDVDVPVFVDLGPRYIEDIVSLQRKPSHAKRHDNYDKHFNDFFLVLQQSNVPQILRVPGRLRSPKLNSHLEERENKSMLSPRPTIIFIHQIYLNINKADYTNWNDILHKNEYVSVN